MFTGIVTSMGRIEKIVTKGDSLRFTILPFKKGYLRDRKKGDSIAVNGACMTIESLSKNRFNITTVNESLKKTNLGDLKINSFVNLEKPMFNKSSFDGHFVMGHVDITGVVEKIVRLKDSWEFYFSFPAKYRNNVIHVGSIAINGISLTVADILNRKNNKVMIKIAIIPHTYKETNFCYLKLKDRVNIEFDMLGKYVLRIIGK